MLCGDMLCGNMRNSVREAAPSSVPSVPSTRTVAGAPHAAPGAHYAALPARWRNPNEVRSSFPEHTPPSPVYYSCVGASEHARVAAPQLEHRAWRVYRSAARGTSTQTTRTQRERGKMEEVVLRKVHEGGGDCVA